MSDDILENPSEFDYANGADDYQEEVGDANAPDSHARGNVEADAEFEFVQPETKPIDETALHEGESLEEYFCRRSHLRQMIKHCRDLKKKHLGTLEQDTVNYAAAMKKFKDEAMKYFDKEIHDPANQPRFPDAIKQGLRWFEGLKSQFIDVLQKHNNIDLFGNQIVLAHEIWEALFNPRRHAHLLPMLDYVAKSGFKWDEGMRPAIILAGAASGGKTTLLKTQSIQMFPGVFDTVTHRTAMTATTSDMNDFKITSIDEAPGWMIGATMGPNAKEQEGSAASSVNKSLDTNKICHVQSMSLQEGKRKRTDTFSSNIGTKMLATNVQLPSRSNPALLRLIVAMVDNIDASNEDAIERIMLKLKEIELDPIKADLVESRRLINFYVFLFELLIAMGICEDVNMDPFVVYFQRFCDKMATSNYYLREPKKVLQIAELTRTATLVYGLKIGLFSEITYKERVENGNFVRFFPKARFFLDVVERHLVCTRSIIIYVCSMCRDMWANKMQIDICSAANKAIIQKHIEIFDDSCFDDLPAHRAKTQQKQLHKFDKNGTLVESSSSSNLLAPDESGELTNAEVEDDEAPLSKEEYSEFDLDENDVVPDNDGNYVDEKVARSIEMSEMNQAMHSMTITDVKKATRTIGSIKNSADDGDDDEADDTEDKEAKQRQKRKKQREAEEEKKLAPQNLTGADSIDVVDIGAIERSAAEINETLQMFMVVFKDGNDALGKINANYIELRGIQMTLEGACQLLIGQSNDGSIASVDNLQTTLKDMQRDEIMAPFYKLEGNKIVRTRERHLIKKARFEKNTKSLDPHEAFGRDVTRIYLATHVVLNNHSLTKAVLSAIRGLGFPGTIPGRCLVNIPVDALRDPKAEKKKISTMYGINRVVRIVPREDPFVFVKSSTITQSMLDHFVDMRRGDARIKVSPTLLNTAYGIYITVEPEITAAIAHAKLCGVPRGTPLIGTPVLLDIEARRIARGVPELRDRKLAAYPRDTMSRFRNRYLVFDLHNNPQRARELYGALPTDTDARRSVTSVVRDNPIREIIRITAMQSVRAVVNLIMPGALVLNTKVTFEMILKRFREPERLREQLREFGITQTKFMDEFQKSPTELAKVSHTFDFEIGNVAKIDKLLAQDEAKLKAAAARGDQKVTTPQLDSDDSMEQDASSSPPPHSAIDDFTTISENFNSLRGLAPAKPVIEAPETGSFFSKLKEVVDVDDVFRDIDNMTPSHGRFLLPDKIGFTAIDINSSRNRKK